MAERHGLFTDGVVLQRQLQQIGAQVAHGAPLLGTPSKQSLKHMMGQGDADALRMTQAWMTDL